MTNFSLPAGRQVWRQILTLINFRSLHNNQGG